MWKLRRVRVEDKEWSDFVSKAPHTLFNESDWACVTESGFGGETCCLLLEKNGKVFAGMLGFIKRVLWARFLYFNFPYGGIIGQCPDKNRLGQLLAGFAQKEGVARIRIFDNPLLSPIHPDGFRLIPTQTHILEIKDRSYDEIWKNFRKTIHRNVRKAIRNGITVEKVRKTTGTDEFFSLHLDAMRRNMAVPKYGKNFVKAVFDYVAGSGKGYLLLARKDGEAVAGILIVNSEHMSHYLMGGSRTDALKYRPNDLLIAEAIRKAVDNNLKYFDFLPSAPEDISLAHFKSKWGAKTFQTDISELLTRPFSMKLWNMAYQLAETRHFRGFLQWYRKRGIV